jgi:tetratricopeptide (TPR) repeat protein
MEAEAAYEKIVDAPGYTRPLTAIDWVNKGSELAADSKYDEAIQAFNNAIEINPQEKLAWAKKGDTLKAIGRTKEANEAYAKANELDAANTISILDHSMASSVNESTNSVITRTNTFSSNDSKAYSWLSLGNVGAGAVGWVWHDPEGNAYHGATLNIPPYSNGSYWPSFNAWYYLDIQEVVDNWKNPHYNPILKTIENPDNPFGNWSVTVTVDCVNDHVSLTEQFTLEGNAIQDNARSYGRAEAEEAEWKDIERQLKEEDIYYHYLIGEEAPLTDYE